VSVRIRVVACGAQFLLAESAVSASNGKGHDHAIATLKIVYVYANFLNNAHEFVSENISLFRRRNETIEQMEIRTTSDDSDKAVRIAKLYAGT